MSIIPGFSFAPKQKKALKPEPYNIFCPIDEGKYTPYKKYMIPDNQFRKNQGVILRFFAQFDDRGELPRDQMKFRNCHIFFYVEDETIKVYEPPQKNSGISQGRLINRNRIPKPEGGHYKLEDLNLGKNISLYGKNFKILDCDAFTKKYLQEMGFRVGTPEALAIDPVYADRQEMDRHRTTFRRPQLEDKSAVFYKSHPKQLHFYAIYNNNPLHFEEIRYVSLYYDITYNTIKIIDEKKLLEYKYQMRLGNYDTYLILKPTLVPKKRGCANPIGKHSTPVILNLNAPNTLQRIQNIMFYAVGGRHNMTGFLRDSNPDNNAIDKEEYYTANDFDLGITLDIFGFEVYIYDCDEFTKEFYRNEFNRELVTVPLPDIKDSRYHIAVYKGNFGNAPNSLQSSKNIPLFNVTKQFTTEDQLLETPGNRDWQIESLLKYYLNSRNGCDSNIFTFLAKVISSDVFLKNQHFKIRWFLEDDTIEIGGLDLPFKLEAQWSENSHAFVNRRKLAKPNSELRNTGCCYYTKRDMFVGNVIYDIKKAFLLTDADEYTFDYMERNCDIFIHSNIKHVMSNIVPLIKAKALDMKKAFENCDLDKTGFIKYADFKNTLRLYIPEERRSEFPEQEIKTLARQFSYEEYTGLKFHELLSRIHYELKKIRFEEFEKLETLFHLFDVDNTNKGHFKPSDIYKILRSYPLSVDRDLLKSYIFKFPQCSGLISFEEVIKSLNYLKNPTPPPDFTPYSININWERVEKMKNLNKVLYANFLKELTNELCTNCK